MDRQDARTPGIESEPSSMLWPMVIEGALEALAPVHTAQVLAYLKATGRTLDLLIHYDVALLKHGIKRVGLSPSAGALASWRSPSSKADFPQWCS